MTYFTELSDRVLLSVKADENAQDFLQSLVTNDIKRANVDHLVYACLLTPQGKFLHDFFVLKGAGTHEYLLDCAEEEALDLLSKLKQYKLRANVDLSMKSGMTLYAFWGAGDDGNDNPQGGLQDPRLPAMGTRLWVEAQTWDETTTQAERVDLKDYHAHRISLGIPDGQRDVKPQLGGVQENNIDILNGVTFDKGCYIGQEVVARIHYKGLLKKRLLPFSVIEGAEPQSGDTPMRDGKKIGEIKSTANGQGLVMTRLEIFENAQDSVICNTEQGKINIFVPDWLKGTILGDVPRV